MTHVTVVLDHIKGHVRAPTKFRESGVYDSIRVGYLSFAQGSCVPCSDRGIRRGVCGVLRARIRCAITLIPPLSAAILWPKTTSLDPLGDLTYDSLRDPM
jgi:hypothetical protein